MVENQSELPEAWQLAIRREKESREFYARMAQSASDASLKALFESLAAEELRHRERLETEYRRLFEADLGLPRGRTGVFEHALRTKGPPLISWHEWDEEAFRLAQELDVPILLSIGAVWCHWCHVMDQTTFGDPEVAALIDRHFLAIRVDNDMRPDINTRYNMGGWPTVAFLTPTGEVLTGGTYMPPAAFKETLKRVSEHYRDNRDSILKRAAELRIERDNIGTPAVAGDIDMSASEAVFLATVGGYDEEFGGFGSAPKFPQADAIELLDNARLEHPAFRKDARGQCPPAVYLPARLPTDGR
jgi:thioredoxin-related protein